MNHLLPSEELRPDPDRSSLGVTVLAGGLAIALLLNLLLGWLYVRAREDVAAMRDRVDQLQRELAGGEVRQPPAGDGLASIAAEVERLRELSFQDPIEPQVLSAASLQERVRSLFREDNPRREFDRLQRVLATLGVITSDDDLWDLFVTAHEEQVAGFYDPEADELVVLGEEIADPSPFTRVILAHEMTHALTDQHFDLTRLDRLRDEGMDDAAAAYLALVEGDATLLMTDYLLTMTVDEQLAAAVEQQEVPSDAFDRMPAFLQESLLFPYSGGLEFVRALHARGGYGAVDDAYLDPPVSTEQILHPERYLGTRDAPVEVELPDVRAALGEGWRRLISGGFGELDLRLVADEQAGSPAGLSSRDAEAAADGWDGGAYAGFGSGRDTVVTVLTAWDSASEAGEAETLLSRWLPTRFGNRGEELDVGEGLGRGWEGSDGAGMVLRSDRGVLIVLGPDETTVRDARAAFDGY